MKGPSTTHLPSPRHRVFANNSPDSPRAWTIAGAAFVVGFVVFGVVYSFGVFLGSITAEFQASQVATSALFSATGLAFYMIGPVTGHLGDRIGPRIMVGAGAVMMGTGLMLTAVIDRLWTGYVTYGVFVGLGAACAYLPALAIVGGWFDRKRGTALGIAAAGTGCGLMIVPPLTAGLIERYGWRPTAITLGIGCTLLLAGCAVAVKRPPLATSDAGQPLRRSIFSSAFALMYASWVLATMALFVPFVFLPVFAVNHGASPTAASALLSIIGGMSILGRLGIGIASDRFGISALFKVSVFVMGASYVLWLISTHYGWLIVFTVVLGLGYGVRIALVPGVLIELFGLQQLGAMLGIFFTATGVASLLGPLLAGFVVDATESFRWGIVFALAMGLLGFLLILPLRMRSSSAGQDESVPPR
jgi:MFS family permease